MLRMPEKEWAVIVSKNAHLIASDSPVVSGDPVFDEYEREAWAEAEEDAEAGDGELEDG